MERKKEKKSATTFNHLWGVRLLEKIYKWVSGILNVKLLDFCLKWVTLIGGWALMAAAGLGFIFSLVFAIRQNSFYAFLIGIGWILLVFLFQFTAEKFSDAGNKLIKNNPTRLSSKAFLECVGLLAAIAGVLTLIMSIIQAVKFKSIETLVMGIAAFILLEFLAVVAFHPKTASIEVAAGSSAGQEAIGIITFFIKGLMRLIPLIFGIGVIVLTIIILVDGIGLFGSMLKAGQAWQKLYRHGSLLLFTALLPFLSYILFVFYYLAIDLIRAILSVPEKLDKLNR